ncbi:hypothetical protein C1645_809175 [Glomus cerebriforme]|uniref:Serine-threonine/tyrosine-protein kinase catalytic domain-containing protein n=1 Tax=Glomus cerebriforme TaxID=658196 RepID=A0A397SL13_9GLOM|nr:hypothetical protein C1645_809175 [Glomus cerebriforme]
MPKNSKLSKEPYTFKCEIFSFAMLLWELGAQKFPYKDKEMKEIISHVTSKNRENFKDFNPSNNGLYHESIAKGFIRIIEGGWAHESNQRPTINNIYQELDRLVETHSPRKRPSNSNSTIITPEDDEDNLIALETIIPLEEGILAHRNGNREVAWKCFELHATLGDPIVIYWKAYYYLKGYNGKADPNKAVKCFKQAADANVPEAQYYYANALEKAKKPGFLFLEYFTKAADNDNVLAQHELGRIYYYGLNGVEKNEEKGIQYLKLAAVKNHQAAINDLKKINPNLIISTENEKKTTN